jgi:hypothetical protein
METIGSFRTRVSRDGAVEVWARGWRLESQVPALVPVVLAAAFWLVPFPVFIRGVGSAALLVCSFGTLRLSRLGFRFERRGITVVDVIRSHSLGWDAFAGIVGERNEHEGRCVVLATDGRRLRSPGTLDPDEMDPYWAAGGAAPIDQLNRLAFRLRRALTSGEEPDMAIDLTVSESTHAGQPVDGDGPQESLSPGARRLRSLDR